MKTVITYGTFDLFHVGHVRLLKRLKGLGCRLIVGISSEERAEIVSSCKYVDEVFSENSWEQKRIDILKFNADIFSIGDDWAGEFDHLNDICEVVYLPRTEDISTTEIKSALAKVNVAELERIESSLHDVIGIVKSLALK